MINSIDGVHIKAISCCVPKGNYSLEEYIPEIVNDKSAKRLAKGTGFSRLGIAADDITTSDLCCRAVEPLLAKMDASAIGALVFVSQTPDYVMPATSHVLQQRLGLRNDILCLDINEGCSGYMTGVYTASLLAKQLNAPVCLLAGDTISKVTLAEDRATRSILGDAGTATIIEPGTHKINFAFASYGDRYDAIIMENSRHRMVPDHKNKGKMYMDGVGVCTLRFTRFLN